MTMKDILDLPSLLDNLERRLSGAAFDAYEICLGSSRTLSLEVVSGELDSFRTAMPVGASIRVLLNGGMGFSHTSSFDDSALERMIDSARAGAVHQTPDPCNLLPQPAICQSFGDLFDDQLYDTPVEQKIGLALAMERQALAHDPRIQRIRKSSYSEIDSTVCIRNSLGVDGSYRATSLSCSISAIAEQDGDAQMGWDFAAGRFFRELDPELTASSAAGKAISLLGAQSVDSMCCPAVLDRYVAAELLEVLAPAFLAENIVKKKSLLVGREGAAIASPLVTIVDDGILQGGLATAPFDAEGVPRQRTGLVRDGILQGTLCDTFYGQRTGRPSTGNSVRSGARGLPQMGITNFFLLPSTTPAASLIAGIGRGILLTDVIGMHTADPVSGDFSVGATGMLVEDGQLTVPVRGIAIAGNILELLARIDAVGDDLRFFGSVGAPSIRLAALDISGK